MNTMKQTTINLIIFLQCLSTLHGSYPSFEEYVEYIMNYINFTAHYKLPTDNLELYQTRDCKIQDFGVFDFIIVGGGTSGSLLAKRLTEIEHWSVLLLEAGETENDFTDIPAMNYYLRATPMNWGYFTKPQENSCLGMIDRRCVYPTGKVLGGSGVLGDMVYARGSRVEYDKWAQQGNRGWSYDDILPYFKKSEQIQIAKYDPGYHGHSGEVFINYTQPDAINYKYFLEANKALGLDEIDYNGENQIGVSRFQWTIDVNKRQTGGSAFILPILNKRANLNVSLKSFVSKVLINEENEAVGVEFVKDGKKYKALTNKEVLLSAGAVNSPQILMLSGIGPEDELKKHNIDVKNNLPVGKYLTDHPVFIGLYVRTSNHVVAEPLSTLLEKYMNGFSPLTSVFAAGPVVFMNTKDKHSRQPNLEIIFINPPLSVPADPVMFYNANQKHVNMFATFNSLTDHLVYLVNIQPKSRGSVTLQSKSPVDFPLIDTQFYTDSNDEDIDVIYEGIQYVINMTKTPALQEINAEIIGTAPECDHLKKVSNREYWYCAIKYLTSTLYHPTGTVRMGNSPRNSVVDFALKVHNMKGLRVIDAGSIPEIMAGHPLAAVFMMAEKVSDEIKSSYSHIH